MLNKFFGAEEGASNEEILQNLLEQKESENKELKKRVQALTDSLHRDAPDSASENHALRYCYFFRFSRWFPMVNLMGVSSFTEGGCLG